MKEFLFLLRGGEAARLNAQESPEQWQQHMMKWKAWMESLTKQGIMTGGQPMNKEGRVVAGSAKKVTDGPFMEGKEIIGGYLIVKANSLKEATDISMDCPIFDLNGIVEVREIQQLEI